VTLAVLPDLIDKVHEQISGRIFIHNRCRPRARGYAFGVSVPGTNIGIVAGRHLVTLGVESVHGEVDVIGTVRQAECDDDFASYTDSGCNAEPESLETKTKLLWLTSL